VSPRTFYVCLASLGRGLYGVSLESCAPASLVSRGGLRERLRRPVGLPHRAPVSEVRDLAAPWAETQRFFSNLPSSGILATVDPLQRKARETDRQPQKGERIALGFDGSHPATQPPSSAAPKPDFSSRSRSSSAPRAREMIGVSTEAVSTAPLRTR
jgi:hypothetical protein